ncbi:TrkH family potassium uptake protein [Desulfosudis oleivorans]|uniref:Potassium uptake protein, TrkH family n=1 Tax=Desulfosudis oleivorans (strain DSM 6200 / JCM 39069 / Hxd3) TaxID=96561 RepID=A9A0A1_DESOH|nr:TrkH family potassium uptake protein [Desulfosudis oleivorans]ABW69020.1 potassium uptake protein, TrkH family [Desulfosudis oleivorans Hxd3]
MSWPRIFYITGYLLVWIGLCMVLPLGVSLYFGEAGVWPFVYAMAVTVSCGLLLIAGFRAGRGEMISHREGMAIVAFCWAGAGFFGALPFYFGNAIPSFTNALFESISGFTTTGASVLSNIEGLERGFLFWRSMIQWLGGMGIIVLSVAILPFLGVGGMQLYKAEVPSPVVDKLQPRIRDTAKTLWRVYLLISVAQVFLLKVGGMSLFDAVCHAFTTMPTGGFSTQNLSIAAYNSAYLDWVVALFMLLAGVNFSLHYQMLRGNTLAFWKNPECRFFLVLVLCLTAVVSLDLHGRAYETIGQSLRYGAFQVVSIITTTGFATADYETWPALSQLILFICMFVGASAGSTGGGMKCIRIMLCVKYCYRELFSMVHPKAVTHVKIGGKTVPDEVMRSVLGFLCLYVLIFIACSFLLAAMGVDAVTSAAAVAASIGNIGPGFGAVGPLDNYANIPVMGKWLLMWCMLLGRLEIYTILILLVPEFWRK